MNNTTCIETEVDTALHNHFTKHMNRLTTLKSEEYLGGRIISKIIDVHLQTITKPDLANNVTKLKTPTTTKPLHINHINPQTHKKFIKHLQKKYGHQNFQEHYNNELNILLFIYLDYTYVPILIIHKATQNACERKEYNKATPHETHQLIKEEFTTICNKCNINPEKLNIQWNIRRGQYL